MGNYCNLCHTACHWPLLDATHPHVGEDPGGVDGRLASRADWG